MTALIVIAAVIIFLALALNIKLRVQIKYLGGELSFRIKYLWFTIYPIKEKKGRKKKRVKKSKRVATRQEKTFEIDDISDAEEPEKKSESKAEKFDDNPEDDDIHAENVNKETLSDKLDRLSELIEKIKIIWGFSEKGLRKIFARIYIEKLMIDFIIAGEDACKTAVSYGTVSAAVYNVIAVISTIFQTKVKSVDIACDFDRKKPVYDVELNITARPSTLISVALCILVGFAKNYKNIMDKSNKRKSNETAAQL
ncbi:MAG: DUF2953 domain-containing protein [Oscillospiraceae bacterium]|nr:DUF2953 domain-containing protein [Oscillospiraceae bacterium]